MPRISRANARQKLAVFLKNFQEGTGESVGVVFTWNGSLSVLGTASYKEHVHCNKQAIWRKLAGASVTKFHKPTYDSECVSMLEEDVSKYNVPTLRRLISWLIQRATGKSRNFWGVPQFKPSWWLKEVPYDDIYRRKYKKQILQNILIAYQAYARSDTQDEPTPMEEILKDDATYDISLDDVKNGYSPVQIPSSPDYIPSSPVQIPSSQIFPQTEIHQLYGDTDLDTSSSDFFPIKLSKQPDTTYNNSVSTKSLAELSGARTIHPVQYTYIEPTILSEKVRTECLAELANPNTFLSDVTINSFCELLKNSYPHVLGLQDTILSQKLQFIKAPRDSIQIHNDSHLHWVCSHLDKNDRVSLYDSLYMESTSEALDTQLALLYRREVGNLAIHVPPNQQQQRGGADCGLFAIANCVALAMGQDPTKQRWRQNKMRLHLSECFRTEKISPFPFIINKKLKSKIQTNREHQFDIEVFCNCRLPSFAFKFMVECPKCRSWYHKPCVGLPNTKAKVPTFECRTCFGKEK